MRLPSVSASIKVEVWSKPSASPAPEDKELAVTIDRSYSDEHETWHEGGPWTIHDLPILQYLLTMAYAQMQLRRTDLPF